MTSRDGFSRVEFERAFRIELVQMLRHGERPMCLRRIAAEVLSAIRQRRGAAEGLRRPNRSLQVPAPHPVLARSPSPGTVIRSRAQGD